MPSYSISGTQQSQPTKWLPVDIKSLALLIAAHNAGELRIVVSNDMKPFSMTIEFEEY